MSDRLFKEVQLQEGALVQFVGCHVVKWPYDLMQPTIGFVEIEDDLQARLAAADETIAELVRALQLVAANDPTAAYSVNAALARVRLDAEKGETK